MLDNVCIREKTLDDAWLRLYTVLNGLDDKSESRDGDIRGEIINANIVIDDPTRCILTNSVRNMSMRYGLGELIWYLLGDNKLESIQLITSAWDRMTDDGETVNSNYGYCIREKFGFNQLDYVIEMLSKYPDSRRAVIHIKEPRNTFENPTNDMNCTVCLQFFIREGKLYETVYMRSNDIWYGLPYDALFFTSIQIYLAMKLGVKLGTYTHVAGSLHLYERNADKA